MGDTITLKRTDLAKFMALCGATIISAATGKALSKSNLKEAYEAHLENGLIEYVIKGSGEDFDAYQASDTEVSAQDLQDFIEELKEEAGDE